MRAIGLVLLLSMVLIAGVAGGCSVSGQSGNVASFAEYPQQVRFGAESGQRVYIQQSGYYAVHYARSEDMVTEGAIGVMEEEAIAVFPGAPQTVPTHAAVSPVYALQPGGSLAVPTGRTFVRLAETMAIDSRQAAIQAAGYEIVDRPVYAPFAAWVQARSGSIADALNNISQLAAIPDVENVEPQMLMQRSLR